MKFTLSWLKRHLDTGASVDKIANALTDIGLEIASITNPADRLKEFTIGKVISASKHPNADRLQVCQVQTDAGIKQIICGAPNARPDINVVVAKPGTYIPGIDTTINVGMIRGIESFGMMCSEREMEISDEHEGIIELPSGKVGEQYIDWLAKNKPSQLELVFDIEITPNRPDALGVRGIARDLAARGIGTLVPLNHFAVTGAFESPISVHIDANTLNGCPLFAGRVIQGVKNQTSPEWLQSQLKAIGLRPISALVDITNFFTVDVARPLHVFDARKIKGNLRIHRAKGGERIETLDEKEYQLNAGTMIISDGNGPRSIAGIIGGCATGVSDQTETVFLESAYWNPVDIALTGRKLKINSDARYRFERGVDPAFTIQGLDAATSMILKICGGKVSKTVIAGAVPEYARSFKFDAERVKSIVGMDISESKQRQILTSLGFELDENMAYVPSWRPDIQGEVDLVEEIARIESLTKLKATPLKRIFEGIPKPVIRPHQRNEVIVRRACASLGYNECLTYSFIDQASASLFCNGNDLTEIENPISSEMSHMRPSLLPGLLMAVLRNQTRGYMDIALFEIGAIFEGIAPEQQRKSVAGVLVGRTGPKDIHGMSRNVDIFDVKADIKAVLKAIGVPKRMQILRGASNYWHPGRHGKLCLNPKQELGVFGEIHPRIVTDLGVQGVVTAFEVKLDNVPQRRNNCPTRFPLVVSDLQVVERDFSFIVDNDVESSTIINAVRSADKSLISDAYIFDVFTGEQIGHKKKSIAFKVRLEPKTKTLTDNDIEHLSKKIILKIKKVTGGNLRE
ncbi:MAG: phenylalanine--tRNA ligase subunit beta [Aestuariivita sp.]|nr:phenylalanine--tRNA ligase subunit beta [Aestuariivita sp.]